jgi:hypothetical protein
VLKEKDGIVLMVSAMFVSCRLGSEHNGRPGLVVGLVILGPNNRLSLYTSDIRRVYPAWSVDVRCPASWLRSSDFLHRRMEL